MYDPTASNIDTLEPRTALAATWLVYVVRNAGVPLIITSARRTTAEQQKLLAAGRTKTLNSKHLQGKAFDVDVYGYSRDAIPRSFWNVVGPWAEANLGLKWGGRWTSLWDPGHFESP